MSSNQPSSSSQIKKAIIRSLRELVPEIKPSTSSSLPYTIKYLGIIDQTLIPDIESLANSSSSTLIRITHITYHNGTSLVHFHPPSTLPPSPLSSVKSSSLTPSTSLSFSAFTSQLTHLQSDFKSDQEHLNPSKLKLKYFGKKSGLINQLTTQISSLPTKHRVQAGKLINQLKKTLFPQIVACDLKISNSNSKDWLDVTAPGTLPLIGHLHPVTQAIHQIQHIFESIGFSRVRYPEVDYDKYVFENLNMPANHPARDEWETFFLDTPKHKKFGEIVLSTHTSNGQTREMERVKTPPIRMLNIAKCYRRQQDVTHTPMFHQFEGLVIDRGINVTHLKGTLDYFARQFYGPKARSRIRPFMFKFTEPSFEVDFSCTHCQGKGCRFCKSGWHETGGAGMVHPNVLKAGGIDPEIYTGFAFGWGVERVYTLKPGLELDDIRPFYQNKIGFLSQF